MSEHRCAWAPHVVGTFGPALLDEDGKPEPRDVSIACEHPGCGATWKTKCSSGNLRGHVNNFAKMHVHRDVFEHPTTNPIERR